MSLPNVLDPCAPVYRVTCGGCSESDPSPTCSGGCISIGRCGPTIVNPPPRKCVNDNVRRPWPSPPPAELGCNPVSVDVLNSPIEPDDDDQGLRLEGSVDYISGDACLPRVNLTLKTPPWMGGGGSSPLVKTGCGYTSLGGAFRIGPLDNDVYATPEDFFKEEYGAESFYPVPSTEWDPTYDCKLCLIKDMFGSQIATYNIIGPMLATVTNNPAPEVIRTESVGSSTIPVAWKYSVALAGNINSLLSPGVPTTDTCATPDSWFNQGNTGDAWPTPMIAYNLKEKVITVGATKVYPPGSDITYLRGRGFSPVPVEPGSPVMLYGFVPWGSSPTAASCNCPITWFFDEHVAFRGACTSSFTEGGGSPESLLPSRTTFNAGEFYGDSNTVNRV